MDNNWQVLIRADGGAGIGIGHWSRVLNFINTHPNISATLFTKQKSGFHKAFPVSTVSVIEVEQETDFFLHVQKKDIVLLDGYFFDTAYFKQLAAQGAIVVYLDDLASPNTWAHAIINHAENAQPHQYVNPAPYCQFYLGFAFSLTAAVFSPSALPDASRINRILIGMGGSDPQLKTIDILEKFHRQLIDYQEINVVIGAHFGAVDRLIKLKSDLPNIIIHHALNQRQLSQLMQHCGCAILPASTMAMEYAHVGGLLGIAQTAENQIGLMNSLLNCQAAIQYPDMFNQNSNQKLEAYQNQQQIQRKIFDGNATMRLRKIWDGLFIQQDVILRRAIPSDALITFTWANEPLVRKYAFTQTPITWDSHKTWFAEKLASNTCTYFIAWLKDKAIGSIRFDSNDTRAVISFLIDPEFHGGGLGKIILAEGIRLFTQETRSTSIEGHVISTNTASINTFIRLGFGRTDFPDKIVFTKNIVAC